MDSLAIIFNHLLKDNNINFNIGHIPNDLYPDNIDLTLNTGTTKSINGVSYFFYNAPYITGYLLISNSIQITFIDMSTSNE